MTIDHGDRIHGYDFVAQADCPICRPLVAMAIRDMFREGWFNADLDPALKAQAEEERA